MRLDDVGIATIEQIKLLAKLAPKEEKDTASGMGQGKKSRQRRSPGADLGRMDVEAYLRHYGIEYNVKASRGKTFYRLSQCLFDPSHTKNEAAIVQDTQGLLTYQCFHNSCQGRKWADARALISGADSLAPFCENYDPQKHVKKPEVPQGSSEFLITDGNKRPRFVPAGLADYLETEFQPIIFEGTAFSKMFYRYCDDGVWRWLPEDDIRTVIRSALGDHATPQRRNQAIEVLQDQTYRPPDKLKIEPKLLNIKNGMFQVDEAKLYPHDPKYNSRVQLPVCYQAGSTCPKWISAMEGIFADDEAKIEVLQQIYGYCLYPKIIFPCALFQIGRGSNGKGTVQKVLSAMLGKENVCHISLTRMEDRFGPVELANKLLNASGETATRALDPTRFKEIAVGEEIQAEVKFGKDVTYTPIAKHLISMNEFPGIKDKTDAFYRRVIVLEYNQSFEGENDVKGIAETVIREELDGVFLWAVEGLKMVLENEQILVPESVQQAKRRFRASSNPVLTFVEETCLLGELTEKGSVIKVLPPNLFKTYKAWCDDGGIPLKMRLGKHKFYEQILTSCKGVTKKRDPGGTKDYYFGIGLRSNLDFEIPE